MQFHSDCDLAGQRPVVHVTASGGSRHCILHDDMALVPAAARGPGYSNPFGSVWPGVCHIIHVRLSQSWSTVMPGCCHYSVVLRPRCPVWLFWLCSSDGCLAVSRRSTAMTSASTPHMGASTSSLVVIGAAEGWGAGRQTTVLSSAAVPKGCSLWGLCPFSVAQSCDAVARWHPTGLLMFYFSCLEVVEQLLNSTPRPLQRFRGLA